MTATRDTADCYPVVGELLGQRNPVHPAIPFKQFFWDGGVDGLAYVDNGELNVLAVHASVSGTGQFRAFIGECKKFYPFIRIWCVMNDGLPQVLARYGFVKGNDVDKLGDMQEVWDWKKK